MAVSDNIRKYRLANKLSQDDLAELCSVARCTVTNWENGRRLPNFDSIKMLAKIFNITMEKLIENDKDEQNKKKEAKAKKRKKKCIKISIICIILVLLLTNLFVKESFINKIDYSIMNTNEITEIILQIDEKNGIGNYQFKKETNTEYSISKIYISEFNTTHYKFQDEIVTNIKIFIKFENVDIRELKDLSAISLGKEQENFMVLDKRSNNIYIKGIGCYTLKIIFKKGIVYLLALPSL